MGTLVSIIIALIVSAVVLLIVDRLNLGLSVDGFGSAVIAALVIAIVGGIVMWLLVSLLGLSIGGGLLGLIIYLVIAAVVLLLSDRLLPGLSVRGFGGAIVAAIGIGVVTWLISWLLGLIGISF